MTCPEVLAPLPGPCANGHCVGADTCACTWPQTGFGDFVLGSPSCDINLNVVSALWAVCACAQGVALAYCLYGHVVLPSRWNRCRPDGKTLIVTLGTVASACLLAVSLTRAAAPEHTAVGTNIATSFLFTVGMFCTYSMSLPVVTTFIGILLRQSKMKRLDAQAHIDRIAKVAASFMPIHMALNAAASVMPVLMLLATSRSAMFGFAAAHYWLCTVMLALVGLVVHPRCVQPLLDDLNEAMNLSSVSEAGRQQIKDVKDKLVFIKDDRVVVVVNVLAAGMFGSWPAAQSFSCYWMPLAWSSASLAIVQSVRMFIPTAATVSSRHEVSVPPVGAAAADDAPAAAAAEA